MSMVQIREMLEEQTALLQVGDSTRMGHGDEHVLSGQATSLNERLGGVGYMLEDFEQQDRVERLVGQRDTLLYEVRVHPPLACQLDVLGVDIRAFDVEPTLGQCST